MVEHPRSPDSWTLILIAALLGLLVVVLTGCTTLPHRLCQDGRPVKLLQHPDCPRGLCGYTCHPDRWRE